MAERVLTSADLNRALLARQFLLERSRLPLTRTLDRIGGIQAQYAPSSYIGLWSRLEGFELADLTRALERRKVVQGTLLRSTIHLVSAGDYWPFAIGTRAARQEAWLRFDKKRLSRSDLTSAAKEVRKTLSGRVLHRDELLDLARKRDPERPTHLWNGLAAWIELVRAPPSGTWERRRADLYALADEWLEPPTVTPEESVEILLRRYLAGFGPARLADAANWAGLAPAPSRRRPKAFVCAAFATRRTVSWSTCRARRSPAASTQAPPSFLPTWDATLLVHARGTQILPERFRPLVFDTKTPHSRRHSSSTAPLRASGTSRRGEEGNAGARAIRAPPGGAKRELRRGGRAARPLPRAGRRRATRRLTLPERAAFRLSRDSLEAGPSLAHRVLLPANYMERKSTTR